MALQLTSTPGSRVRRGGQAGLTLVELLVVMAILAVVGTMIIMGWWAATQSMAYTSDSAQARDDARFAIDRMTREIRDSQVPSSTYITNAGFSSTTPAIVRARPMMIAVFTSFNVPGSMPVVSPRLAIYCVYPDGDLWRYADLDGNGINGASGSTTQWATSLSSLTNAIAAGGATANTFEASASSWEGADKLASDVVNWQIPSTSSPTDVFEYVSYDDTGNQQLQDTVLGDQNRSNIVSVQLTVLADLNPSHSPVYMNLQTTAQLRNAR